MQWAIANSYAVFRHDLDFGTMLALSGADGPSMAESPFAFFRGPPKIMVFPIPGGESRRLHHTEPESG